MGNESTEITYDSSKDPKRKANSKDPGWKYGFWPDLSRKDLIQCNLCGREITQGIKRLKQHLAKGYGDVVACRNTTTKIMKEMRDYILKNSRNKPFTLVDNDDANDGDEGPQDVSLEGTQPSSHNSVSHLSSGTSSKRKQAALRFSQPPSKSIAAMVRKTPEEIVDERHSKSYQKTLEECTKSKEEKDRVAMHVAYYFYDCGIPFNTITARSFEVMLESVAQIGTGWRPPSYHDVRVKLLERAKKEIDLLLEKHKVAWKRYECTLMSDGWTDRRNRHLINFLINSPEGTFFLESVDASGESHDAAMLARLLKGKIQEIGKENVVQLVTDNGANYKAAGRLLEEKIPSLFWTSCASHCLDLMLEDIGKLPEFKQKIESARRTTTFIYRHGRILSAMREFTGGKDLVRPGVTSDHWSTSKLANTEAGKKVYDSVFSTRFWTGVEDCIKASQPILVMLRIVDADEIPAMAEVAMAMEIAKKKLNEAFASQPRILSKLMDIV
ncbi:uncharacterized protein LOC116020254 [Ipomoea triloba]|uniref:uncharacterized protein LOC116020254 n=1 Tax=Ipomoea triloba TaxID=35885 RepID=UPI00125D3B9E|nr:uncharacterized protein LOC116020254 [Ipomoea triloba]